MFLLGLAHLIRATARWLVGGHRQDQRIRTLLFADQLFTLWWLGVSVSLLLLLPLIDAPVLGPALGAAVAFTIWAVGLGIAADTAEKEEELGIPGATAWIVNKPAMRRWRARVETGAHVLGAAWLQRTWSVTPPGKLSLYLGLTLSPAFLAALAYTGLALVELAELLAHLRGNSPHP